MLKVLRSLSIISAATFTLLVFSSMLDLGAFGVNSVFGILGLSIGLALCAQIVFAGTAIAVCMPLGIQDPGVLLFSAIGVFAGTVTLYVFALQWPSLVLFASFVEAIPYAAANTALIWMIGFGTGATRREQVLLPTFKRK